MVNHALLAFNMVLDGQIVQPREAIVIDEAHEFECYVVGALRLKLEYDQVPALANDSVVTRNADEGIRGRAVHNDAFSSGRCGNLCLGLLVAPGSACQCHPV